MSVRVMSCRPPTFVRVRSGYVTYFYAFSEGNWTLKAYINSLQSPSENVLGSLVYEVNGSSLH